MDGVVWQYRGRELEEVGVGVYEVVSRRPEA